MKRREFVTKSSCGVAAALLHPVFTLPVFDEAFENLSALKTKLNVKFIIHDGVHEDAWEGSCRWGDLSAMTYEAEKGRLDKNYDSFIGELKNMQFFPELEILDPVKTMTFIKKGNPKITYSEDELKKFIPDMNKTDVYVLMGGGLPHIPGMRIGEQFKKPVILANTPGWGVGLPASLRDIGLEGYYAQNNQQLKDILNLMFVRKAISNTRLLTVVSSVPENNPKSQLNILKEKYNLNFHFVDYSEFFNAMDRLKNDSKSMRQAQSLGESLIKNSKSCNMKLDDVIHSIQFYQTTSHFLEKYSCNAFTIECFELCSSINPWTRRFTPCLCHALLKDIGYPSACEGDLNAWMSMMIQMYISRKAVYLGNPDVDIANNTLKTHHSVASLKMNGLDQADSSYDIASFTNSGFGVTLRHDFREYLNKEMTICRMNSSGTKLLLTKGYIIDGVTGSGCGCEQSVTLKIPNANDLLIKQQNYGCHLTLVYGDYCSQIVALGRMMGFEIDAVL
jgi:hypothetical protein